MQNLKWSLKEKRFFSLTATLRRQLTKTHYEILQLQQDCTAKEVRDAFVRLSKKFHPDVKGVNSDKKQSAAFVQISEAYQILSKPKTRSAYDQELLVRGTRISPHMNTPNNNGMNRSWEIKPDIDPNPGPYYGFKTVGRISNSRIVLGLAIFTIVGAILSFFAVSTYYNFRNSVTFKKQKLDQQSAEASIHHETVRADANKYGNQEQVRRLVERMLRRES